MTDSHLMFREMVQVQNTLSLTAAMTKEKIDARMRATVKDLLRHRYALEPEPIEEYNKRRGKMLQVGIVDLFTDALLHVDSSNKRRDMYNYEELNRTRPLRIYNYVQRLADICPPEHLTHLLQTSLRMTPEALISFYEASQNDAKLSDYTGQPSSIDPNVFKNHD